MILIWVVILSFIVLVDHIGALKWHLTFQWIKLWGFYMEIINKLKEISKNYWYGLPYGSYHHPKLTLEGATYQQNPKCQRDTKSRFEKIGLTKGGLSGKFVLDLGCNTGSMLLYARQLGANEVYGIDNHAPNIYFCKDLFSFVEEENHTFLVSSADSITLNQFNAEVIFCLAISKWVRDYDHLIRILSESGAELIWFEDNKHMGKIIEDIIPGYDCEFKFFSGPEANTKVGWKRVNYLCRRKK